MSRALTFLGLFQVACVVIGFFALGIILKVCGYPDDGSPLIRWSPLAVFLRSEGLWLLVLPVLWVCHAVYARTRNGGFFSERISFSVGVAMAGVIILVFLYAAVFPFSRVLLILPTKQTWVQEFAERAG